MAAIMPAGVSPYTHTSQRFWAHSRLPLSKTIITTRLRIIEVFIFCQYLSMSIAARTGAALFVPAGIIYLIRYPGFCFSSGLVSISCDGMGKSVSESLTMIAGSCALTACFSFAGAQQVEAALPFESEIPAFFLSARNPGMPQRSGRPPGLWQTVRSGAGHVRGASPG